MGLLDLLKGAKPAELQALREALAAAPAKGGRPEMDPAERKALGAELAASYERVIVTGRAAAEAKRAELEARIKAAQDALYALFSEQDQAGYAYTTRRDEAMRRLWAERPPEADALIREVEAEAHGLRVESYNLPTVPPSGVGALSYTGPRATGRLLQDGKVDDVAPRSITNAASVEARRAALFALAEQLREWTRKGSYGTVAELQAMHSKAYKALPQVEPLRDVVMRDARGRKALQAA